MSGTPAQQENSAKIEAQHQTLRKVWWRITGALLDRLTHHVHTLEMNGESFRLVASKKAQRQPAQATTASPKTPTEGEADTKT